jgi:AraC family transcriptional regulator
MSYCRWDSELTFYRMNLSPSFLHDVALKSGFNFSGNVELHHQLHMQDPKLFQISQWLADELQNEGASGQLYFDSLSNLLAVYLLQNFASAQRNSSLQLNKLSKQQISRVIEYMYANLVRDISLNELAGVANMSASHLIRLFKQTTGMAPHKYFIHLRVQQAKSLIQSSKFSMIEIAAQLGFADQSHMNRHFKKIVGVTPREFLLKN